MPPRARAGDRERLEAALGPHLGALRAACDVLGVPRERWQAVPVLERLYTTVAVLRLAAGYRENGTGARSALDRAAIACGLSPDTIHSRIRRLGL